VATLAAARFLGYPFPMHDTPASLLERLCRQPRDGDWERFVRLFTPLLSRWANRFGVPTTDTEDALQEVFVLLFRRLPLFRRDPEGSFRAWLWTVFRRELLAHHQRTGKLPSATAAQLEQLLTPDGVPEASEAEFRKALVERALQLVKRDFPDKTWQVFWRLSVEGQSGVQVAKEFGVSPNAVYLARGRVLARLRAELAGLDGV
jgi:RNA polymerase sigma-70 factor (ECF subfamily)